MVHYVPLMFYLEWPTQRFPRTKLTGLEKHETAAAPTTSECALPGCIQPTGVSSRAGSLPIEPVSDIVNEPWAARHNAEIWDNTGDWRSDSTGVF